MIHVVLLASMVLAAVSGVPGLWWKSGRTAHVVLMVLAAVCGLSAAALGMVQGSPETGVFANALTSGAARAMVFRVDALSAAFMIPLWVVAVGACISGWGLWKDDQHASAPATRLWFGLLIAGIAGVLCAAGPVSFLVCWEVMALAAFLAIASEHHHREVQRAGWLYMAATRVGTLTLFALFITWASLNGWGPFQSLRPGMAESGAVTALFILALVGFGLKAGMFPLHFWLPAAHAAAPSHVSAVMSGVLIKAGIYGIMRVCSWVPDPPLWWGTTVLVLGVVSGILGVGYALGSHDVKRLLAYHSIENIGIILIGLGLGLMGRSLNNPMLATLGYAGAILHVFNHATFKSLLFLAGGAAAHSAGTRHIDALGGMARISPATAGLFALGAAAISGLPPFNGFVSEWFIYNGLFAGSSVGATSSLSLVGITALALIGGLCLACFAKVTGAVFLGEPRSTHAREAHPIHPVAVYGMLVPAAACVLIGVVPGVTLLPLDAAVHVAAPGIKSVPITAASDAQAIAMGITPLLAVGGLLWWWLSIKQVGSARTVTWDCGYAMPQVRMQYTASSFASIILGGLRMVLRPRTHAPNLAEEHGMPQVDRMFPATQSFHSHVPDMIMDRLLVPVANGVTWLFGGLRIAQSGSIHLYLLYVVLTLVCMLAWSLS